MCNFNCARIPSQREQKVPIWQHFFPVVESIHEIVLSELKSVDRRPSTLDRRPSTTVCTTVDRHFVHQSIQSIKKQYVTILK